MDGQTFIKEYANKMKNIQETLLRFVENEDSNDLEFDNIFKYLNDHQILENKQELKTVLHIISKISDHHYRSQDFINKIEKLLKKLQNDIKKNYSNFDIFNIFKSNKRILLFLFKEEILILDNTIKYIIINGKYKTYFYPEYFSIELNLNKHENDLIEFEEKRKIGQNDSYICQLIRDDLIEDFIAYINRTNLSLSSQIENSLFETNPFLLKHPNPSLIEYCTFFGSIQIFKYLRINGVEVKNTLWLYAIHGNNPEIINLFEENGNNLCYRKVLSFVSDKNLPLKCFQEAAKCHHIDIMIYIKDNFTELNISFKSLPYYNFIEFCNNDYMDLRYTGKDLFATFCKYDYYIIVDFLLKNEKININSKDISLNTF